MSENVKYDAELGIIRVVNSGRVTAERFKVRTLKLLALARENRTGLILIDNSKLELAVTMSEIFEMPQFYENSQASKNGRVAMLQPAKGDIRKEFRFYETVCRNRGWPLQVFTDPDEAIAWLLAKPGKTQPDSDNV